MVSMQAILAQAGRGGYGVGSFSPRNTFLIEAVLRAAQAQHSPVIVQISANEFRWFNLDAKAFADRFFALKDRFDVPCVLHLDHTKDMDTIKEAIAAGFNAVMIDASDRDFEENVGITKAVVDYAHDKGVCVEAELGRIGATDKVETDGDVTFYTDPEEAAAFVQRTGVDSLAVSIGSAHGVYPVKDPRIDYDRLKAIRAAVTVPLVLHGGSGLPYETIHRAIALGVSKVNIATDLEQVFLPAIGQTERLSNQAIWALPPAVLDRGALAVQALVEEKMQDFVKSSNR